MPAGLFFVPNPGLAGKTAVFPSNVDPLRWHGYCSGFLRTMTTVPPAPRSGILLRKLLTILAGLVLFVILAGLLAVWALGRFSPGLADSALADATGAHLAVETNDTNLLVGRLSYAGITVTNPTRWTEREFLKIRRFHLDVDPWSFAGSGTQKIHEAELDIDRVVVTGKSDKLLELLGDNNTLDISKALKAEARETASPGPGGTPPAPRPYEIGKLRVRVGHLTVVGGDGTSRRRVLIDQDINFVFEAQNVTDRNEKETIQKPLQAMLQKELTKAATQLLFDVRAERLRPSVTEKLLGDK